MSKITTERNKNALLEMVLMPGNDVCADCRARNPRWASHNLGIFICVNCASIHRKIGTHITKVKSLTLDSWTKDQVDVMRQNGNVKSNNYYNPNEARNPPPTNMAESERDSELEQYIRAKYEYKRYRVVDKSAFVAERLGPSRSAASITSSRPKSTPLSESSSSASVASNTSQTIPRQIPSTQPAPQRPQPTSSAPPIAPCLPSKSFTQSQSAVAQSPLPPQPPTQSSNPVWADLVSLQGPSVQANYPLQFQSPPPQQQQQQPTGWPMNAQNTGMPFSNMGTNPGSGMMFSPQQQQSPMMTGISPSPAYSSPTGMGTSVSSYQPPMFQPQSSFGQQQLYGQPQPMQQTPPPQVFQPQPQAMAGAPNPYQMTSQPSYSPSPFGGMGTVMNGSPSPYGQIPMQQGSPSGFPMQQQQQQPPQMGYQQPMQQPGAPFVNWMTNGPGNPQQHWG